MPSKQAKHFYGWKPDKPDYRDKKYMIPAHFTAGDLPKKIDLRPQMPEIYTQGNLGSCHDDITEVLTQDGWKFFIDLNEKDYLATVNSKNCELTYEQPKRLIRFNYNGDMYYGKNQSLDFAVTPEHKMLVKKWNSLNRKLNDEYELIEMKDIGWYNGLMNEIVYNGIEDKEYFILNGVDHKLKYQREDFAIPMDNWLQFLGIYLAEGTMLKQYPNQMYKIQITAVKEREKNFIRQVLKDIGVKALELKDRFTFENKRIYESMRLLGLMGVKSFDKFVPNFVFNLNKEKIKKFLFGHFMGDGCEQYGVKSYYTSSKILANDLQRLILLSGGWGLISSRGPRTSKMKNGKIVIRRHKEYRVSQWASRGLSLDKNMCVKVKKYIGEVFCAEVPTHHTLITRRNGKILISGNCTGQAIGADCHYQLGFQKASIWKPSALFIYYNERLIEGTVSQDSGAELRDGMKAINRWGICSEQMCPYDISKFRVKPTRAAYNEASKHKIIDYARIPQTLNHLKSVLAQKDPFVFGFSVYESFEGDRVAKTGIMSMPSPQERLTGGHAVCGVGFDDETQAFIVRNSWGKSWGMDGYFLMPYSYIINNDLADDFWTIRHVPVN